MLFQYFNFRIFGIAIHQFTSYAKSNTKNSLLYYLFCFTLLCFLQGIRVDKDGGVKITLDLFVPGHPHAEKVKTLRSVLIRPDENPNRFCVVCESTVQYRTVQSTVQYSTVQYTTLHYTTLHYTTLHYTTIQYSTVQYSTVQYSTVQYSTVQYSTIQYRNIFSMHLT